MTELPPKRYSIEVKGESQISSLLIGAGAVKHLNSLITSNKTVLVADAQLPEALIRSVTTTISLSSSHIFLVTHAESAKSVEGVASIWSFFSELGVDRSTSVISLGGGALSDLVGFAAATYMRGIPLISIPTTLLAQVDAAIGGKTGINFAGVKNLVGVTKQPSAVILDQSLLSTLPKRELLSGFAEVVKHGLIRDISYFQKVTSRAATNWSETELAEIVERSVEIKQNIIESDPYERGARKLLNLGHTIGHALESIARECGIDMTHGEAVAHGIISESKLAMLLGRYDNSVHEGIVSGLESVGFSQTVPEELRAKLTSENLLSKIKADKKNKNGVIKWSLLTGIGTADFDLVASDEQIISVVKELLP